jgi:hypothetical protein
VLQNFDHAIQANAISLSSAGYAAKLNTTYMQSLQAQLNGLKAAFVNLVTDNDGLGGFLKLLISTGTELLKFAETDAGKAIIGITLVSVAYGKLNTILKAVAISLSKVAVAHATVEMSSFAKNAQSAAASATGMSTAVGSIGKSLISLISSIPVVGQIALAILGAGAALYAYNEKQQKLLDNSKKAIESSKSEINSLTQSQSLLKNENITRQELNAIVDSTIGKYSDEIGSIDDLNKARQTAIDKIEEEKKKKEEAALESGKMAYRNAYQKEYNNYDVTLPSNLNVDTNFNSSKQSDNSKYTTYNSTSLSSYIKSLKDLKTALEKVVTPTKEQEEALKTVNTELRKNSDESDSASKMLKDQGKIAADLGKKYNALTHSWDDMSDSEKEWAKQQKQEDAINKKLASSQSKLENNMGETDDELEDYATKLGVSTKQLQAYEDQTGLSGEQLYNFTNALGINTKKLIENAARANMSVEAYAQQQIKIKQLNDAFKNANSAMDSYQSAMKTLSAAQDEYNSTGEYSVDTMQKLLALDPQYLSNLYNSTDALNGNSDATNTLADAIVNAYAAKLADAYASDSAALAAGNLDKMSQGAKAAISAAGASSGTAGQQAQNAVAGFNNLSIAMANAMAAMGQTGDNNRKKDQQALNDYYQKIIDNVNKIKSSVSSAAGSAKSAAKSAGGAGKSAAKEAEEAAKEASEAWKNSYDEQKAALDHRLAMNAISEDTYYKKLAELNEQYFGEASEYHQKYLSEYRKNEETLYEWYKKQIQNKMDDYKTAMDYIDKQLNNMLDDLKKEEEEELDSIQDDIDALNDEKDAFDDAEQDKIDAIQDEKDAFDDSTQDKIDALSDEKDAFESTIEAEIDALEAKKDAESDEWDAKIDALETENDELEKQKELESLLEALAKAQNTKVKVLRNGKFQYVTDQSGVDSAQKDLQDYYDSLKQEKQKQILEDAKNSAEKNYQQQIDDLKAYEKSVSNNYQKQIDDLNDLKDDKDKSYEAQLKALNAFKDAQDKVYEQQIKDLEEYKDEVQEDYDEQVEAMEEYIKQYEDYMNTYEERENKHIADMKTNGQAENKEWLLRLDNLKNFVEEYNRLQEELNEANESGDREDKDTEEDDRPKDGMVDDSPAVEDTYADGVYSTSSDKIALVGENKELVVGSKLNSGTVTRLASGSGVIPHNLTNTLVTMARVFNSDVGSGTTVNNRSTGNVFHIGNISLPQVKNGEDFVKYLSNFNMKQFAYSH